MQIKTFTYIKKSGEYYIELPDRLLHMDSHVTSLLSEGWETINSANDPGHVRVGKTLVVAGLTGGLSLLFGGSRTANTITLTFKKTTTHVGYCASCGNPLLGEGGFCWKCGAKCKGATSASPNSETPGNMEPCRCKQCGAPVGEGISYCCDCRSKSSRTQVAAPKAVLYPGQAESRAIAEGTPLRLTDAHGGAYGSTSWKIPWGLQPKWILLAFAGLVLVLVRLVSMAPVTQPGSVGADAPATPASDTSSFEQVKPEIDFKQMALRQRATVEGAIGRPTTTERVEFSSPVITMAKYPWGELYYQEGRLTGLEYRFRARPSLIEAALFAVGLEMTSPPEEHPMYFSWSDGPSSFRPEAGHHPLICCGFGYELPWVSVSKGLDTIWVDFAYLDQRAKWPAALLSAWQKLDQ